MKCILDRENKGRVDEEILSNVLLRTFYRRESEVKNALSYLG